MKKLTQAQYEELLRFMEHDDAVLPSCLSELDDNLYDAVRTVAEARADLSDVLNDLWLEMCAQQPD